MTQNFQQQSNESYIMELTQQLDAMTKRAEKAESELSAVMSEVQRHQPGGSPPPSDCATLAAWILTSLSERAEKAEAELDEVRTLANMAAKSRDENMVRLSGLLNRVKELEGALVIARGRAVQHGDPITAAKERVVDTAVPAARSIERILAHRCDSKNCDNPLCRHLTAIDALLALTLSNNIKP